MQVGRFRGPGRPSYGTLTQNGAESLSHCRGCLVRGYGLDVGVEDLDLDVVPVARRCHGGRHRPEVDHAVAEVAAAE